MGLPEESEAHLPSQGRAQDEWDRLHELDILIPDMGLAIESNGDYWHSEEKIEETRKMSSWDYRMLKISLCRAEGVDLLYVWQSEWRNAREGTERRIERFINGDLPHIERTIMIMNSGDLH